MKKLLIIAAALVVSANAAAFMPTFAPEFKNTVVKSFKAGYQVINQMSLGTSTVENFSGSIYEGEVYRTAIEAGFSVEDANSIVEAHISSVKSGEVAYNQEHLAVVVSTYVATPSTFVPSQGGNGGNGNGGGIQDLSGTYYDTRDGISYVFKDNKDGTVTTTNDRNGSSYTIDREFHKNVVRDAFPAN